MAKINGRDGWKGKKQLINSQGLQFKTQRQKVSQYEYVTQRTTIVRHRMIRQTRSSPENNQRVKIVSDMDSSGKNTPWRTQFQAQASKFYDSKMASTSVYFFAQGSISSQIYVPMDKPLYSMAMGYIAGIFLTKVTVNISFFLVLHTQQMIHQYYGVVMLSKAKLIAYLDSAWADYSMVSRPKIYKTLHSLGTVGGKLS